MTTLSAPMPTPSVEYGLLSPILIVFGVAVVGVLVEGLLPRRARYGTQVVLAIGGLIVNVAAFWVLTQGDNNNLNVRAAALHVAGDLLGSVAALAAALIIIFTGWTPIDPILSVLVALIILRSAWRIVTESGHILLEGAPHDFDRAAVARAIEQNVPGVVRVHHVHAWSITEERPMATLQAQVTADTDTEAARLAIKNLLAREFGGGHATVEIEVLN